MSSTRGMRLIAPLAIAALVMGSCGGDSDSAGSGDCPLTEDQVAEAADIEVMASTTADNDDYVLCTYQGEWTPAGGTKSPDIDYSVTVQVSTYKTAEAGQHAFERADEFGEDVDGVGDAAVVDSGAVVVQVGDTWYRTSYSPRESRETGDPEAIGLARAIVDSSN